jgi:predicted DsbA family dithiol-disulfide isomerase
MDSHPESDGAGGPDPNALHIDVVSDVVCPWCFIGKRQLEDALQQWGERHPDAQMPTVTWHPFQLNPDMPAEGMAREEYMRRKFGRSDTGAIYANVRRAAQESGLALNLEAIVRQPNTLRPHALLQVAESIGAQHQMAEILFEAYFLSGRDLTDPAVLAELGARAGLDADAVQAALEDPALQQQVADRDQQAREAGIGGVPFFIVNNKVAVSGAQGVERLLKAFERGLAAA